MPLENLKIGLNDIASVASALAAFFALFFSYRSNAIAKKALSIAEADNKRKNAKISASLINSYKTSTKDELSHVFAICVTIANQSDLPNTISNVELAVSYRHASDLIAKAILKHSEDVGEILNIQDYKFPELPLKIDAREAITEWFVFHVKKEHLRNTAIDGYSLRIYDHLNMITEVIPTMINDIQSKNEIS